MATIKVKDNRSNQFGGFAPYGNLTTLRYPLSTDATGAAINATANTPIVAGTVVDLGSLPEGFLLEDVLVIVQVGMTATITGSLGFVYEDGVDDAAVPQDAAYFGAGLNLATAARLRMSTSKLVTLPKPARLILTTAVADNAKASAITVAVHGERTGAQ